MVVSDHNEFWGVLLTGYHGIPSNGQQEYSNITNILIWIQELEEFDYEPKRVGYNAGSSGKHTPKINAVVSLERNKYQDEQFNGIVQCKTEKERNDDFEAERVARVTFDAGLLVCNSASAHTHSHTSCYTCTCRVNSTLCRCRLSNQCCDGGTCKHSCW